METTQQLFNIAGNEVCINTIIDNDIVYYKVIDLYHILNVSNSRAFIKNINNENKKLFPIEKVNLSGEKVGGKQKTRFITLDGVKMILGKTRSTIANEFAKQFGIDVITRISSHECETIQTILEVFRGESMECQYYVNGYRIDLYFIEYKLAIECDEPHHINRIKYDIARQNKIEKELNCTFIRYNPCHRDFNINFTLNQIFRHIKNYTHSTHTS
jgi:very-short-patch-repair endonuclease